jgi:hypothetical protein
MKKKVTRMNSLTIKLGIIFFIIGLSIFGYAEVWGQDWKYYGETYIGRWLYDAKSLTRPSRDIVRIQEKQIYTEEGVYFMKKEMEDRGENLSYSIALEEIDCRNKKFRVLQITHYSKSGEILFFHNCSDIRYWEYVVPNTVKEILLKAVCK